MRTLRQKLVDGLDDALRHRSIFGEMRFFRNLLRKPYHYLLNLHKGGLTLNLGHCVEVRVPAQFASKLMEEYEADEFRIIHEWCQKTPDGLFVDIGCSVGYMSCAALFSSASVEVLALDSDLNSLQSTRLVCAQAKHLERLHVAQALVAEMSTQAVDWQVLESSALDQLQASGATGQPGTTRYICLDDQQAGLQIPFVALDDMLQKEIVQSRPMLIKCDVEGAECQVLRGGGRLFKETKPLLLLSVHPRYLARFGGSMEQINHALKDCSYDHKLISVDHEEHWLCYPAGSAS